MDFANGSAEQIIDLITDGRSSLPTVTTTERNNAIAAGLDQFNSIGVGTKADLAELDALAFPQPSGGNSGFVMPAPDFTDVQATLEQKLTLELPVDLMSFAIE